MPSSVSSQTSSPHTTRPRSGRTSPATTRNTDVLPAPDGPASARQVPAGTSSATSSENAPSRVAASTRSTAEPRRAAQQLDRQQQCGGDGDEYRRERKRAGKVGREALVDRQRNRLRDPAKRAREHQRRAELPERPS